MKLQSGLPTEILDARRRGVKLAFARSEDGLQTIEASGPTEGATLIAVGQWLQHQSAVGRERLVEDIDWAVSGDGRAHTLIVTVSRTGDSAAGAAELKSLRPALPDGPQPA
ncbi:MAG TPA: hypothetical protein VFE65_08840 [Pseudonocardia sp.]|jgi:hypothetical protein|nr:hypothetical protein [Pseudonocardia sp.]